MKEMISIVVPVYNAEKTLERCVRSLQNQSYENLEIILVNDGSRDGSLEMCRSYARQDGRILVIDKPNGGVSSARNAGLDAARGHFVMFCDSDDWVEPDWCGCMAENHVPGSLTVFEIYREDVPMDAHPQPVEVVSRETYLHYPMLICAPYNKIFERSVLEANQIRFRKELSLGEDFVFCLTYVTAITGQIRFVYRPLYNYDTTNENSLSRRAPALEQCCRFYEEVTKAMLRISGGDPKSVATRDWFVAPHFERFLCATVDNAELSLEEKMEIARKVSNMEAFRATSSAIRWGNPVLLRLYHSGNLKLWMAAKIAIRKFK